MIIRQYMSKQLITIVNLFYEHNRIKLNTITIEVAILFYGMIPVSNKIFKITISSFTQQNDFN